MSRSQRSTDYRNGKGCREGRGCPVCGDTSAVRRAREAELGEADADEGAFLQTYGLNYYDWDVCPYPDCMCDECNPPAEGDVLEAPGAIAKLGDVLRRAA
jgi:hypothetical protein